MAFYSIKLKNSLKKTTIVRNSFIFWIAFAFPLEFCLFYEIKNLKKKTAFVCQTPCNNNNNVCCLSFLGWVDWLTSLVVFTRSRKKIGARAIWRILERIWVDTRKHFCEVNLQNGIMSLPPLNYSRWKQISFLPRVDSNYWKSLLPIVDPFFHMYRENFTFLVCNKRTWIFMWTHEEMKIISCRLSVW